MIRNIPLNKLVASPRNVRRSGDERADAELKADIEARGLLQNLVVSPARKPRGAFAVEAGGRRSCALKALLAEGKLAKGHEVCCLVIEDQGTAQEASLAENFQRLSMNPADECLAFQQLIDQGGDVEGVARRFGLTGRFVEGRLRLAALAPAIFAALGSGEISLDLAKAYAATPDHERQLYVFEQIGRGYAPHPDSVRRMMTQATVAASDRRARFVGEEAYVAAGGRIECDLFSDGADARWLDVALLERLASEKLEAAADELKADSGLGFVRATLERWVDPSQLEGLRRVAVDRPPLSDEEAATVEALEAELDEYADCLEDEDSTDEQRDQAEARIRELNSKIEAIADKPPVIDEVLKPGLGAFLMLDEEGRPRLDGSYYGEAGSDASSSSGDAANGNRTGATAGTAEPKSLSQRLVDELAIQRRDILSVHLAADPELALDLAAFLLADREAGYCYEKSGSSLSALPPPNPATGFKTPDAPATIAAAKAGDELDRSWTDQASRAARFDAFRAMPGQARQAWLASVIARSLEASLNLAGGRRCAFHDHLGQILGIDVAQWWRPTGANFFDRVPKKVIFDAFTEVGGPAFAAAYAGLKKAELSQSAERVFAGEVIAEIEVKQRALSWVPEPMRFAPDPEPEEASDDEPAPWEDQPAAGADWTADGEPESGGDDDEAGGAMPSRIEEAA